MKSELRETLTKQHIHNKIYSDTVQEEDEEAQVTGSPLSFSAMDPAWPWPSQDGSILQQRGARQQVQEMSWGRTKRKGGREKKKQQRERKQNKNKGQRLVMIGGGGGWEKARERTIANSPDTQTCAKHVCTCADIQKLFAVTLAALSEHKRTDTWFSAKPGWTHSPALKKKRQRYVGSDVLKKNRNYHNHSRRTILFVFREQITF